MGGLRIFVMAIDRQNCLYAACAAALQHRILKVFGCNARKRGSSVTGPSRLPDVKPPCWTWPGTAVPGPFFEPDACAGWYGGPPSWRPSRNDVGIVRLR